jgi:hypothetical protein
MRLPTPESASDFIRTIKMQHADVLFKERALSIAE